MLLDVGLLLAGLLVLSLGAEWLVRGAASVAIGLGVRPLIVGLTVVAMGTSFPEFVTNVLAALQGEIGHGLALGNIVGSNIANIGLILGLTVLLAPVAVSSSTLKREFPIMFGVQVIFLLMALDGMISRLDGAILLAIQIGFMAYLVRDARRTPLAPADLEDTPQVLPPWHRTALVVVGIGALALGAHLMVMAAINIALGFGISSIIIGLTVVAIGTSLPELAASIMSVMRGQPDFTVGNVLGSNLFNVLFVVGLVALLAPLRVDPVALQVHFPVMLGFCALIALAWFGRRLGRIHGALYLSAFMAYMAYLVVPLL